MFKMEESLVGARERFRDIVRYVPSGYWNMIIKVAYGIAVWSCCWKNFKSTVTKVNNNNAKLALLSEVITAPSPPLSFSTLAD